METKSGFRSIWLLNPAPDADLHSVGKANFEWIVKEVADLAIAKAEIAPQAPQLRWAAFLGGEAAAAAKRKPAAKKTVAKASAKKKAAK